MDAKRMLLHRLPERFASNIIFYLTEVSGLEDLEDQWGIILSQMYPDIAAKWAAALRETESTIKVGEN